MTNWHDAISEHDLVPVKTGPIVFCIKCSRCGRWFEYESDTGLCETCEQDETIEAAAGADAALPSASGDARVGPSGAEHRAK